MTGHIKQFPKNCIAEKSICKNIKKGHRNAVFSIKDTLRIFYLHAYQSYEFNKELSNLLKEDYKEDEELVLKGSKIKRKAFTPIKEFSFRKDENNFIFSFVLEPSTYATVVIRELLGDPM